MMVGLPGETMADIDELAPLRAGAGPGGARGWRSASRRSWPSATRRSTARRSPAWPRSTRGSPACARWWPGGSSCGPPRPSGPGWSTGWPRGASPPGWPRSQAGRAGGRFADWRSALAEVPEPEVVPAPAPRPTRPAAPEPGARRGLNLLASASRVAPRADKLRSGPKLAADTGADPGVLHRERAGGRAEPAGARRDLRRPAGHAHPGAVGARSLPAAGGGAGLPDDAVAGADPGHRLRPACAAWAAGESEDAAARLPGDLRPARPARADPLPEGVLRQDQHRGGGRRGPDHHAGHLLFAVRLGRADVQRHLARPQPAGRWWASS